MSRAEGALPHNEPFICLSPRLAPTLNFPISCWRRALAPVPGREPGRHGDGSAGAFPLLFGLVLQERGQCGVSRGEDIPPAVLGCSDEPAPKQLQRAAVGMQRDGRACGIPLGCSGMAPGDTAFACEGPQGLVKMLPT